MNEFGEAYLPLGLCAEGRRPDIDYLLESEENDGEQSEV